MGEWSSKDGRSHVLEFAATLNGMQLRGVDIITLTPDGDKMIELEVRGRDDVVREGECLMTRRVVGYVFDLCVARPPPLACPGDDETRQCPRATVQRNGQASDGQAVMQHDGAGGGAKQSTPSSATSRSVQVHRPHRCLEK